MWDGCGLFCPAVRALGVTGWFVTGAAVKHTQISGFTLPRVRHKVPAHTEL